MMWDGYGLHGWGWWGFGLLHMIGFWVLLVAGVVLLVRWLRGPAGRPTESGQLGPPGMAVHETALDVLKKRYARGEIDKVEFENMKKDLAD